MGVRRLKRVGDVSGVGRRHDALLGINTTPGGAYFSFEYGNGQFSIGNNGCTCEDLSNGLQAESGCKCAFPVDGSV